MRLAIADPPYLGRAARWYGDGRGHGGGRGRADEHPEARKRDLLETHLELLRRLETDYDGWAYAGAPDYLAQLADAIPADARTMIWHRGNAIASGARIRATYEFVIIRPPPGRHRHGTGLAVDDVLSAGIDTSQRFAGAKPPAWTRWVLAALGHQPGTDHVDDLFRGTGAVDAAVDGFLPIPTMSDTKE